MHAVLAAVPTFDYVVVGIGQAGSAIAARLAEHGAYTVFGIEAGVRTHRSLGGKDYVAASYELDENGKVVLGEPYTRFDVPAFFFTISASPSPYSDWPAYYNGVLTSSTTAKLLGGAGAHNGNIWIRMTKQTIDSWGVTGWSYEEVLEYYKKSENCSASNTCSNPAYHGFDGPVGMSDVPTDRSYSSVPVWLQACVNYGLPSNPDYDGVNRTGCGTHVYNIERGIRDSAANAYLPNALNTGRLTISLESEATKILIRKNSAGKYVARGVQYVRNNITRKVRARKEVILALGAILTPKLLMLSGVGPAAHLTQHGINVKVDSPNVGKHLQTNHVAVGTYEFPGANYHPADRAGIPAIEYAMYGTGPWAHPGQMSFAYTCSKSNCTEPDISVGTCVDPDAKKILTIIATAHPQSRGKVELISNNYADPPNITYDYFEKIEDLNAMVYGYKLMREIMATPPAPTMFGAEITPGPAYVTDEQLATYVRNNVDVRYHWVGSTKMGNAGDPTAAVDNRLRVVGVRRLRVGDTSVLPSVNSHSSASAVMAGERAAAFALQDA